MKWIKKGLIIEPDNSLDWMITHAAVPTADWISDDLFRIYFCGRNNQNMSQVGYAEININEPKKILYITEQPILKLGPLGSFDDSAVMPSWIVNYNDKKYLYYIGWIQGKRIPYCASTGLAISTDGGKSFRKYSKAPILPKSDIDPYMTASSCVIIENGKWRMWYLSGVKWEIENFAPKPFYHIKYAESKNGISWDCRGIVCIDLKSKDEHCIARPSVLIEDGIYQMWYSHRGKSYRIGYAESEDGLHWIRKDSEVGIDVSPSGWDSEMIAHPFVFKHKGLKYMFYNGNNYGKSGIGLAIGEGE